MLNKNKMISIIAPMFNEQDLVKEFCSILIEAIQGLSDQYNFEILLVDDGSKDNTLKVMEEVQSVYPGIIGIVQLSRNFGLEGAVHAGLIKAIGDAVIVMDGDLQDPPALIPLMIQKWSEGTDIVVAKRTKRKYDSTFKRWSAGLYYCVLDSLSGKVKMEHNAANFRLMDRKAVNQIIDLTEVNRVFRVVCPYIGMKTDTIEYYRDQRYSGKTKYNLSSMIRYALDSIIGLSIEPLRKLIILPVLSFIIMLVFIVLSAFSYIPFISLGLIIVLMSFFFTLLFAGLLILAEYIGHIMVEVKHRPTSIIYSYRPSKPLKEE